MSEWSKGTVCKTVGSNPTPDSTLIYLPMDRKLRRELSKRKWISRAKKVYNSCGKFYIPVNGIKASIMFLFSEIEH